MMNEADILKRYQDIINRDEILNENPTFTEVTEEDLNPELNEEDLTEAPKEKRYVVEFSMYMWDTDDEAVMEQATKFTDQLRQKFDNQALVTEIVEQPFATMGNREVYKR